MSSIPITADYAQAVGTRCEKVENRSLILDKLAQASTDWRTGEKDNQAKKNSLQRLSAKNIEQDSIAEARKKHTLRFLSLLKKTYEKDHRLAIVYAKLESRLAINLTDGIIENAGMSLDRIFGLPIIPGSAVKGVARHAAWEEEQAATSADEKERLRKLRIRVFGNENSARNDVVLNQGAVSFLQAMPYGKTDIVVDIVNCHSPRYYNSDTNAQPTQEESPIPCYFPAVEAGAEFAFPIVLNGLDPDPEVLKAAKGWLERTLTENGLGAKTAAGYGWFSVDDQVAKQMAENLIEFEQQEREEREREERQKKEKQMEQLPIDVDQEILENLKKLCEDVGKFNQMVKHVARNSKVRDPKFMPELDSPAKRRAFLELLEGKSERSGNAAKAYDYLASKLENAENRGDAN